MARAIGSYPIGHGFKSSSRYHIRPVGQAVKTRPFHGCNMGSIPVRVTKKTKHHFCGALFFCFPRTRNLTHHRALRGIGFAFLTKRRLPLASNLVGKNSSRSEPSRTVCIIDPSFCEAKNYGQECDQAFLVLFVATRQIVSRFLYGDFFAVLRDLLCILPQRRPP